MGREGFEPSRLAAYGPEPYVSAIPPPAHSMMAYKKLQRRKAENSLKHCVLEYSLGEILSLVDQELSKRLEPISKFHLDSDTESEF